MKHILHMLRQTFAVSTAVMLIYRSNIVFFLLFETLFLAAQFLTIGVGFKLAGGNIGGWSPSEAYLLTACNALSHQIFICFFINGIFSLGVQVWNGQFDYVLLKPLHPLFSILVNSQFVVSNLPNLIVNAAIVVWLLTRVESPHGVVTWFTFAFMMGTGLAVRVALALLCIAPVFYSEKLADIDSSFWSLASLGRYPMKIYPRTLELLLTFVLPLGMLASVPVGFWIGRDGWLWAAGALGAACAFVIGSTMLFMRCLRRYQSVNTGI